MKLGEWIEREDMTQSVAAKQIEVTVGMLCQVLLGNRRFGWKNANKIVAMTKGEVTLEDLGWKVGAA